MKEPSEINLNLKEDSRGTLNEILRFRDFCVPGNGQIYTFSINPLKRRGDHYHTKKDEWFTCVLGSVKVLCTNVDEKDFVYEISEKDPKTIYVPKLITHALVNTCNTRAIIVSYGSEQHNHNDNDTFYKKACPNMFFS